VNRRHFFCLPAFAVITAQSRLLEDTVPGALYRDYSRCLPDYLGDLAARAERLRNAELAKLTTAAAIRGRQRWVRETFWKLAGGMPERTPLNTRTTGSFAREGYRVEKLVYESRPNFHVSANLYIPTAGRPPFPGVLFQMGHSPNGKAFDGYQRCCQALAKLGFLVLAFDPMGQGERIYYPDASGTRSRLGAAWEEHNMAGKQMLLAGDTCPRLQVWDAVRSLDCLASHPLADPQRLGSTGQSGGGTTTMLLTCVDDRLAAAVVVSGNTENLASASFNAPGSTDDAEQNFPGAGPLGFDRWDLLFPMAPKPLLVSVSDKDFLNTYSAQYITNGRQEYQKLRKVYQILGHANHLAWASTPLPHGMTYDLRLQIYNWFTRWLKDETSRIEVEPSTAPEREQTLWVCDSGNLMRSFHGETPMTQNRKRTVTRVKQPAALDHLLGIRRPAPGTQFTILRRVPSLEGEIESVEVLSEAKVWVPAWLFLPKTPDRSKQAFLVVDPGGHNARWHEGMVYQTLAAKGHPVCSTDVRGVGDLRPEFGRGHPRYAESHNAEDHYAWASLILGKPLLGQRVTDLLAAAAALRAHPALSGRRLVLAAMGRMTIPALFAAALDSRIDALYLAGGLVSYQSLVDAEDFVCPVANLVPDLLRHLDLPGIVASLAPRRVVLAGTVGADDKKLDPALVRKTYAEAANVQVLPDARWDVNAFLA
jgi:cephalosporin-C deacetylase-like acetyl esterase